MSRLKLWHLALAATAVAAFVFVAPAGAGTSDLNIVDHGNRGIYNTPDIPSNFVEPEAQGLAAGGITIHNPGQECTNSPVTAEEFNGCPFGASARACSGGFNGSTPNACCPGGILANMVMRERPPRGSSGLALWGTGFIGQAVKNGVAANFFVDSFDITISGPLAASAVYVKFWQVSWFGSSPATQFSVFDSFGALMDTAIATLAPGAGGEIDVELTDNTKVLGRFNWFSTNNQAEGVYAVYFFDDCRLGGGGGSCDLTPVLDALDRLEAKADAAEGKLDRLEAKADAAEGKLDKLQSDMDDVHDMLKELLRLAITPHGQRDTNCIGPAGHPDGKDIASYCSMPIPFTNGGGNLRQR